jgi:hypothetical protein
MVALILSEYCQQRVLQLSFQLIKSGSEALALRLTVSKTSADPIWRKPITGIACSCARTVRGQVPTGPLSVDANSRRAAAMVADAQFDLFRIRATKISILERGFEHFLNDATTEAPLPDNDASRTIEMFRRALPELPTLDRYVRRAFSRRKFAIRALYAHTG